MDLRATVEDRLEADRVDARVASLVVGSLLGPEALARVIAGNGERPLPDLGSRIGDELSAPSGVYLRSITATGFRGIADSAAIDLAPGPGLTLIVGRNGSGKSSFSEALEVLLTGESWRWRDRSAVWKQGWCNVHWKEARSVGATFIAEGSRSDIKLERHWPQGSTTLDEGETTLTGQGLAGATLATAGWLKPLELYTPILSHTELESMLTESPTALFDAMSAMLGLDPLVGASKTLRGARLELQQHRKEAEREAAELRQALTDVQDDRASASLAALSGSWELNQLEKIVHGIDAGSSTEEIRTLSNLAAIRVPSTQAVESATADLRASVATLTALADSPAATARELMDLLKIAAARHEHQGDQACPVCGVGRLDADWRSKADRTIADLSEQASEYEAALEGQRSAITNARSLLPPAPDVLNRAADVGLDGSKVTDIWQAWGDLPDDPVALADEVEAAAAALHAAVGQLAGAAKAQLDAREAAWRPLAAQIGNWLHKAREAEVASPVVENLSNAEKWLKRTVSQLRDERFTPISRHAQRLWDRLRYESNVALDGIVLAGSGSHRKLELDASVDGEPAAALGVMSQGELNCLAVSLFLPRATIAESPFRFVVIDDPVQAMDPVRVDGLARVLSEVAESRQVVVFTHDDRLAEAVRRLALAATILQVHRRPRSVVEVRKTAAPRDQYFVDAVAVAKDPNTPANVVARVVPGLCRLGIEAACMEVVRRRRLGRGDSHAKVEESLAEVKRLTGFASLAFFDDVDRGGEVLRHINRTWGSRAGDVFQDANRGAHKAFRGDVSGFVSAARALAEGIAES